MKRTLLAIAAFGLLMAGFAAPAQAQRGATVAIEIASAGFIIGVESGRGVLVFRGQQYPLRIGGVSAGATLGVSSARLAGTVTGLRNVQDIEGTYTATSASLAIIAGGRAARLRNAKGVVMNLRGQQVGLEISLDLSGMQVALAR